MIFSGYPLSVLETFAEAQADLSLRLNPNIFKNICEDLGKTQIGIIFTSYRGAFSLGANGLGSRKSKLHLVSIY